MTVKTLQAVARVIYEHQPVADERPPWNELAPRWRVFWVNVADRAIDTYLRAVDDD